MAPKDRVDFEKELLKIMHVAFEQNSEELPQKFFYPKLVEFTERGLHINLNFSDPLLVSQGEFADRVKIKLLRSYFLVVSPVKAGLLDSDRRNLAELVLDEEYVTFSKEIPKQLLNLEDLKTLENSAAVTKGLLEQGFVLTFVMNFVLNGVMS